MKNILEELWDGNITPQTRTVNRGTHYEEALDMMCKNEDILNAKLSDQEKEVFEKYCNCRDEVDFYTEKDIFITGFRLGARIIVESFSENNSFFVED